MADSENEDLSFKLSHIQPFFNERTLLVASTNGMVHTIEMDSLKASNEYKIHKNRVAAACIVPLSEN